MASMEKRLQKELQALLKDPPNGVKVDSDSIYKNLSEWIVDLDGAPGTLYEGEKFQLAFKFGSRYPFDSPQVMFIGGNIPLHPHVYSNGHICLSILTDDWSPALSVQSVCLSIVSMLSSCKEKKRPPDDSFYVKTCSKNPKKTRWWYHAKKEQVLGNFRNIQLEYVLKETLVAPGPESRMTKNLTASDRYSKSKENDTVWTYIPRMIQFDTHRKLCLKQISAKSNTEGRTGSCAKSMLSSRTFLINPSVAF